MTEPRRAVEGSDLYRRTIVLSEDDRERMKDLMHKVWDRTPWMLDAYTGSCGADRWHEIVEWCTEQFGPEGWPIHDRPGQWHMGGATIDGWTWIGFATEEMMNRFIERFGDRQP